jgi:NitT/TauT family transport system permease protein
MATVIETAPPATATRVPARARPPLGSRKALLIVLQVATVVVLLGAWELGARAGTVNTFLFSSPSQVLEALSRRATSGDLAVDVRTTLTEVLLGFLVGAVGGSVLGLALWYSRFVADYTAPFIAAIGAIPVLAVAPMTIIWFGTGLLSKIMIVGFSCVVVSLTSSYRGAQRADPDQVDLMRSFGASTGQIFTKVVAPGALPWIVQGLKLNVGFAVVGAIVGEYISSDAGVGHMILLGSSNFTVSLVLAGLVVVMAIVLLLTFAMNLLERALLSWERTTS